jgi:hypothetical protein
VAAAATKGTKKQWAFEIFTQVEPAPRRKRDAEGNIPFRSNPGFLVDNRAIEFALHRPTMHLDGEPKEKLGSDKRNKDVVIHSSLMSGLYGSNNNLSALTVRKQDTSDLCKKILRFIYLGFMSFNRRQMERKRSVFIWSGI